MKVENKESGSGKCQKISENIRKGQLKIDCHDKHKQKDDII